MIDQSSKRKDRYRSWILLLLIIAGIFFGRAIESTGDAAIVIMTKVLALPLAIVVFSFAYLSPKAIPPDVARRYPRWFGMVSLYVAALLLAWASMMAINAFAMEGEPIVYSGPVVDKQQTTGKYAHNTIRFRDLSSGEMIERDLGLDAYKNTALGARYCVAFDRGLFGIPFRWKYFNQARYDALCEMAAVPKSNNR